MSASLLYDIRKQLGYYGVPTLLVCGNIGNFFTVWILGRTLKQRMNSCALYLLCAALANWMVIDTVLVSSYYGIDHLEPIHSSNALCKLRWYGGHVLFFASRNFMIVACIDRWALCSQNANVRRICQPKVAVRLTIFICVFTSLVPIPLFFFFDNGSGLCAINASDNLAYTTFALIAIGILPPGSMIIFTILARYNLTQIRGRVQVHDEQPAQQMHIRKRDYDLLKMLVGEVILFCATTSVYPASTLYNYLTGPLREYKSAMRLAVESLIGYIIHPLLSFTYCCTQFYVYLYFSKKFRTDFVALFRRSIRISDAVTLESTDRRTIK